MVSHDVRAVMFWHGTQWGVSTFLFMFGTEPSGSPTPPDLPASVPLHAGCRHRRFRRTKIATQATESPCLAHVCSASPLGAATYPRASGVRPCGSCAPSGRPWRRVPTPRPATVAYLFPYLARPSSPAPRARCRRPATPPGGAWACAAYPCSGDAHSPWPGILRPGAARGPGGPPFQQLICFAQPLPCAQSGLQLSNNCVAQ